MKRLSMYLYALLKCIYIFTFGYLFKKNRKLISNMCELFGYQKIKEYIDPDIKTSIPKIGIDEIVDDRVTIRLIEMPWADGNISLLELAVISKIIQAYKPKKIFEIGTFDGRTTLNMASNSPEEARVYTLDLPGQGETSVRPEILTPDNSFVNKAITGSRFHGTKCAGKISQLYGDSAVFDFSPYNGSMDLVLVDGAHTYDYLLSDTEKAMKLLKDGKGIIIWHDYSWVWGGVTKALNKLYAANDKLKIMRHIKDTSLVCYINPAK